MDCGGSGPCHTMRRGTFLFNETGGFRGSRPFSALRPFNDLAPDFESLEAVPARWSALNGARRRKARRRTFSRGDAMENQLLQQKQRNTRNPMPESRAAMEPMIPGMPTMGRTAERIRPTMPTTIRAIMIAFTECTSLCVCADCAARGILCTSRTACQKSPNGLFAQVNEIERTRLRA